MPTKLDVVAACRKYWFLLLLVPACIYAWVMSYPSATVSYSTDAKNELLYAWNVKHKTRLDKLPPGDEAFATGDLLPDEKFFMEFSWRDGKGHSHCISLTPSRRKTHVYLDAGGNLEPDKGSATDNTLLKRCRLDLVRPDQDISHVTGTSKATNPT